MNGETRKELLLVDHENDIEYEKRNKQCMASGSNGRYVLCHVRVLGSIPRREVVRSAAAPGK